MLRRLIAGSILFYDAIRLNRYEILKVQFEPVCGLDPRRDAMGEPIEVVPLFDDEESGAIPLNKYGRGPFCEFRIPVGREGAAGVYLISVANSVMYVGECEDLVRRFNAGYGHISGRNCYLDGQSTNCRINTLVLHEVKQGRIPTLYFHPTPDRFPLEDYFIRALRPPWNRTH